MSKDVQIKLRQCRDTIDAIDCQVVELLNQRVQHRTGPEQYDSACEAEILSKLVKLNHGPLSNEALSAIYKELILANLNEGHIH